MKTILFVIVGVAMSMTVYGDIQKSEIVPTPIKPVVDEYHGVKVTDNYRWLEDASSSDVKNWTIAQNELTRNYLDKLSSLKDIKEKLQKWNSFESPVYRAIAYRSGTFFALKLEPPKNQPILVRLSSLDDLATEHVVVDPNKIDSKGTTSIDFFSPSLDGRYVAVSLSQGGSEEGTVHIYETGSGKELPDQIPLVNKPTGGGSVAWNKDGTGFYYTRYPGTDERPKEDLDFYQQIYFHKLGEAIKNDQYSLGKDFPKIAEIQLATSRDGNHVLATVANGDGGEFAHYVLNNSGKWVQLTQFSDKVTFGKFGLHDDLYLVSLKDAPRGKVLKLSLSAPDLKSAKTVVKEGAGVVEEILPTESRLYVHYLVGGPSEIHIFEMSGKTHGKIDVKPLSDIWNLTRTEKDDFVFGSQTYVDPVSWSVYDAAKGHVQKTALVTKSPVDFGDVEVRREFAKSKDGTKVPITILSKKGLKKNSSNPTLLYGYGGYSISMTPRFSPDLHLWLEHGGVYVVANIRGGGEFGESWHRSGNLAKKQNVFDDFIASAEHLIKSGYTSPNHLAIEGGSNGGLLMGAALTQRPELFKAVISHVGIYDMLRVELDPNGAFNVTEFGTVKDPDLFKALYGYSPYHHVADGKAYPATMLLTGVNDGRVSPYHSKKMTARLQAATSSKEPILLRVTFDGGHGIGRSISQKVAEEADVYAFLFEQLSMKY